ncbi:MAG: DUF4476 domain-containing protein [Cyclobacteriaceae bacterium]
MKITINPWRLAVIVLLAASPLCAQPTQKWITLYTDEFSGNHYDFGVGRYDNQYLLLSGIPMVHSVRVPAGMKVTLYSEDQYRGTALTLTRDANKAFLSEKGFTDLRLSISIVVEEDRELPANSDQPMVIIYKDDFTGTSQRLTNGRYDMNDIGAVGNDHISSLRIPKGMKVTLYEHQNFTGRALSLTSDTPASFLVKNRFNDVTTSLVVETLEVAPPPTEPRDEPTVTSPSPPVTPTQPEVAETEATTGVVIFQGDFTGISKQLTEPGNYNVQGMGIGNNELSSIKVPQGYRVTLYDGEAFSGRSLVLEENDASSSFLESKKFNNVTSSLEIARIQRVQIFEDAFSGQASRLAPGQYDIDALGIANDQLSSLQVPEGWWALLFEHDNFKGKSLLVTRDTDPTYLRNRGFDNNTSSLVIGDARASLPQVIVYKDNLSGTSQRLTPGSFEHPDLEVGNNAISSVSVPRGLRVILFENSDFSGRTLETTRTVDSEFLTQHQFNDITSAVQVLWRRPEEMVVTIFSERFQGRTQKLEPGRYEAENITIGYKALSSLRVPKGMRVTLHETDKLTGFSTTIEKDTDFTGKIALDNKFASIIVEDVLSPIVSTPVVETPIVVETTITPADTDATDVTEIAEEISSPDCTMSDADYRQAWDAINGKSFSQEKMDMALIVTNGKCLNNSQIAGIARLFNYEDQTLEFVKGTYELATEKNTYYTLQDVFKFMSTKEAFLAFLKER